jgi:hypothetical protein
MLFLRNCVRDAIKDKRLNFLRTIEINKKAVYMAAGIDIFVFLYQIALYNLPAYISSQYCICSLAISS